VGLSAGFLEPLESTGVVLIEAAVAMIAELFPHGPGQRPRPPFNELMTARYDNIIVFLKLHYCLSQRTENRSGATTPTRPRLKRQDSCRPTASAPSAPRR
jgi:tryptophan halogenase